MSRSRSPSEGARELDTRDRRRSDVSTRSRPSMDVDEDAPVKRQRVADNKKEDKTRGKRLFGNILGTLQQFKKEDRSSRTSEAAKKREQISEKIASKLRSETTLQHEIVEAERELKTLRISTESAEFTLKHKSLALTARHATLGPTSKFLHTSIPSSAPPVFDGGLLNPSPIPIAVGPKREPPHPHDAKPLYYLPKILLPSQEDTLSSQIANIAELTASETAALEKEAASVSETVRSNRARIQELSAKLSGLRKQVRPAGTAARGDKDDFGRTRRESMEVRIETNGTDDKMDGGESTQEPEKDKEAGVQIKGEDGDVEVEY